jgi:hypothetical protein
MPFSKETAYMLDSWDLTASRGTAIYFFISISRSAPGPGYHGISSQQQSNQSMKLVTHLCLVPRSGMSATKLHAPICWQGMRLRHRGKLTFFLLSVMVDIYIDLFLEI